MECLAKDREDLLTLYDFPAEHSLGARPDEQRDSVCILDGPSTDRADVQLRFQGHAQAMAFKLARALRNAGVS